MSRHLADHRAKSTGGRLKAFCQIEKSGREGAIHRSSCDLHKRPASRTGVARVEHYIRIERGITA